VPELAWLGVLTVIAVAGVLLLGSKGFGFFPVLMVRHFAVAFVLLVVLFSPIRRWLALVSERIAGSAATVASVSFGLYVLHFPLLVQTDAANTVWFVPALAITIVLACVSDRWLPTILPRAPRN
jgi:peptidoglycan/LPS O-acetylase OafA/YrhL